MVDQAAVLWAAVHEVAVQEPEVYELISVGSWLAVFYEPLWAVQWARNSTLQVERHIGVFLEMSPPPHSFQ